MFAADVVYAMRAHAEREFPRESCGVVAGERYLPCVNVSPRPLFGFEIAAAAVPDRVDAVVHSHPENATGPWSEAPSAADMRAQIGWRLPWGIVPVGRGGVAREPFWWGDGVPTAPLVGRRYRHGVADCYALVRDYCRDRGVELPEIPRSWGGASDLYEALWRPTAAKAGLAEIPIDDARTGDILLIATRRGRIDHAGVLCGPDTVLHHPGGRAPYDPTVLSRRVPAARVSRFVAAVLGPPR